MKTATTARTLRNEIEGTDQGDTDLAHRLDLLADRYGYDCIGPWRVRMSDFHNGAPVSRHRYAIRAIRAASNPCSADCMCGGDVVELDTD